MEIEIAETLCCNNLTVKFYLTTLRKKLKKLNVTDTEVYELIDNSRKVLHVMKRQGQHMENRLKLFNHAICDILGYKRNRKGKKKPWD